MTLKTKILTLPPAGPGATRQLQVLHFEGVRPGPKAYIQAAIHADEVPALLVAQHLRERLTELDAQGRINGTIILVPYANPIGLTQFLQGWHLGRYELDSGRNFNRGYPDLFEPVRAAVAEQLGADADANVRLIRAAIRAALPRETPAAENDALKHALYAMSCDADVVLDLHCDYEATLHTYLGTPLWPAAADLAHCLGSSVNLLADDSGGEAFDEANSRIWWRLAAAFPQHPIPPAGFAATVELRGDRDVDDALAAQDADGLLRFLAGRGFVQGMENPAAVTITAEGTPLEAVDSISATVPGVLVWSLPVGATVKTGDRLGTLMDPETGARTEVRARNNGVLFARRGHRWVRPGQWIAKVAGHSPLAWRKTGALLPE